MSYQNKRRILVTSALPYANGSLHLGHLLEHIQTDMCGFGIKSQKDMNATIYVLTTRMAPLSCLKLKRKTNS